MFGDFVITIYSLFCKSVIKNLLSNFVMVFWIPSNLLEETS